MRWNFLALPLVTDEKKIPRILTMSLKFSAEKNDLHKFYNECSVVLEIVVMAEGSWFKVTFF